MAARPLLIQLDKSPEPYGYLFEVRVPAGLPVSGVVLADQLKSLGWRARQAELAARLPPQTTQEILQKLLVLLEV